MEAMDMSWRRRNVFVTGCTGLLGAWLTDWLIRQQATVVGLVRDSVPASNFHRMGLDGRLTVVRGAIEEFDLIERILNEYEVEVVFHLAAQTIVGIANENPRSISSAASLATFATDVRRWKACFEALVDDLGRQGARLIGYGAAAKGNRLS